MNRPVPPTRLPPILASLSAHWGWLVARGIAAIVFGILAVMMPRLTVLTLAIIWGAYAIVDGAFALVYGARGGGKRRWTYVIIGLIGVIAGLVAFFWPGETAIVLVMIIGVWAFFTGILRSFTRSSTGVPSRTRGRWGFRGRSRPRSAFSSRCSPARVRSR